MSAVETFWVVCRDVAIPFVDREAAETRIEGIHAAFDANPDVCGQEHEVVAFDLDPIKGSEFSLLSWWQRHADSDGQGMLHRLLHDEVRSEREAATRQLNVILKVRGL